MTPFWVMPIGIARGWGMKEINSAIFHYLHWTLHQTCYHLDNFLWCSYLYLEWSMRLHVRRRLFLFIDSELTFGFPPKIPDCSSLECHFTCLSTYLENMGDPPVLHNNFMKNKPWSRNSWRMTKCRWLSNQVIYKPWDHTHPDQYLRQCRIDRIPTNHLSEQGPIYTPSEKIFLTLILP